jgi:hypothetical protein
MTGRVHSGASGSRPVPGGLPEKGRGPLLLAPAALGEGRCSGVGWCGPRAFSARRHRARSSHGPRGQPPCRCGPWQHRAAGIRRACPIRRVVPPPSVRTPVGMGRWRPHAPVSGCRRPTTGLHTGRTAAAHQQLRSGGTLSTVAITATIVSPHSGYCKAIFDMKSAPVGGGGPWGTASRRAASTVEVATIPCPTRTERQRPRSGQPPPQVKKGTSAADAPPQIRQHQDLAALGQPAPPPFRRGARENPAVKFGLFERLDRICAPRLPWRPLPAQFYHRSGAHYPAGQVIGMHRRIQAMAAGRGHPRLRHHDDTRPSWPLPRPGQDSGRRTTTRASPTVPLPMITEVIFCV